MLKISWPKYLSKYCKKDSSVRWSHPENFLKPWFVTFRCQKYFKKGTRKWQKTFTLRAFKKCTGWLHFTLHIHKGNSKRWISSHRFSTDPDFVVKLKNNWVLRLFHFHFSCITSNFSATLMIINFLSQHK